MSKLKSFQRLALIIVVGAMFACSTDPVESVYTGFEKNLRARLVGANANKSSIESEMLNKLMSIGSFRETPYVALHWAWAKVGPDGINRLGLTYAGVDCSANKIEIETTDGEKHIYEIPSEYIRENKKDEGTGVPYSAAIRTGSFIKEIKSIKIFRMP